jgi:hypothetical protein
MNIGISEEKRSEETRAAATAGTGGLGIFTERFAGDESGHSTAS